MIPTKGSSLGRFGGWRRRYPGGTESDSIFATARIDAKPACRLPPADPLDLNRVADLPIQLHELHPQPSAFNTESVLLLEFYSGAYRRGFVSERDWRIADFRKDLKRTLDDPERMAGFAYDR